MIYEMIVAEPAPCGAVSTRGITIFVPACWRCRCLEGFMIRGWHRILPGWRWLYKPRVGVSTPCGALSIR